MRCCPRTYCPRRLLVRPPAAFKTVKGLSAATPGHVLLLEYMEERPLMMLQTGMGMRLTTYYRCGMETSQWGVRQALAQACLCCHTHPML